MGIGDYKPRAKPRDISDAVRRSWTEAEQRAQEEQQVREYLVGTGRFGEIEVGRMSRDELTEAIKNYADNALMGRDSAVRSEFTEHVIKRVDDVQSETEIRQFLVGTGRFGEVEVDRMDRDQVHQALTNYAENLLMGTDSAVRSDITADVIRRTRDAQDSTGVMKGSDTTHDDDGPKEGSSSSQNPTDDPIGEDPFVVPGSQSPNDTERGDEVLDQNEFGTDADDEPPAPVDEEDDHGGDGPAPADDAQAGEDEEDSGYSGPPTSFEAEDEDYSQTDEDGNELSDEEAFGETDTDDDDDDDSDDAGGSGESGGAAGGGAGYVLPPGDSDHRFNQTGPGRHFSGLPERVSSPLTSGGDVDPIDDDFGSGVPDDGSPRRVVPGVSDPAEPGSPSPIGRGVGSLTRHDGVTDPAPDDDALGGIGPEDDPFAGSRPGLEEEAPDHSAADDAFDDGADDGDDDGAFALPHTHSRLEEAIDDGDVHLLHDGPDGHLMIDPS